MAQGYQTYLEISEEGTQLGTESLVWGVNSEKFNTGLYINDESMGAAHEQKFLTEIGRTGTQDRAVKRHRNMGIKCEGGHTFVVYPEGGGDKAGIGLLLKHLFGGITSGTFSGAGTALHTFTPSDNLFGALAGSVGTALGEGTGRVYGLTVHIGREDDPGTIRNYPYLGCRVRSMTFSCASGEELIGTVDYVGRISKPSETARTPSFPSMEPFQWKDATFQIGVAEDGSGGTERAVDAFSITIANNLTELWVYGTNVLGRVVPNGQRVVTGSFTTPYTTWARTELEKWKAGTASSINMAFVTGPYTLEFRCPNIYYTGTPPNVSSMEENIVEFPFQALLSTNFDCRVFLTNTDNTIGFGLN